MLLADRVTAQTFTTLHSFSATPPYSPHTNSDGAGPEAGLVSSGTTLYGTASGGGDSGNGTVFAVNLDGTGFTNLHSFTALSTPYSGTNGDGASPNAGLILSGNRLYGTATRGGSADNGTVFGVLTNGTGFTTLHHFSPTAGPGLTNWDGAVPLAGLVSSGNTLYGTAGAGGEWGAGIVFAINTDGTGFTNLHTFTDRTTNAVGVYTNGDGAHPYAGLVLSGNTLYGTAGYGGSSGAGTVFAVNTDGTGFATLHSFTAPDPTYYTNSDGANPYAQLILSGSILYGTAPSAGSWGHGTVFALNTDGTGFMTLHSFAGYPTEGESPWAGLVLSGNALYGTTSDGGSSGNGTIFGVLADGSGFTNLYDFSAGSGSYPDLTNSDGANPYGGLILSGNILYGTAFSAGSSSQGTVFSLSLSRPTLTITISGPYTTLKWPANDPAIFASGFHVQTTTDPLPHSPATLWVNLVAVPLIMNGEFTVLLANSYVAQRVYRLWQ